MTVPAGVRDSIRKILWERAEDLRWQDLSSGEKSKYYESWTREEALGGVLSRYIDATHVRVYIKDTLLKDFTRTRMAEPRRPLKAIGINPDLEEIEGIETFEKPYGVRLRDGRVVCWGRADAWKAILLAVHERAFEKGEPYGAVLMSSPRFHDLDARRVVESAARKLGIHKLDWLD